MISFFRRIRRHLAAENKVAKYMRYAIGEIILVVIGILIAIQLNNLNIKYKERAGNQQLIHKFIEEIDANQNRISLLRNLNNGTKRTIEMCDSVLNYISSDLDSIIVKYIFTTDIYNWNLPSYQRSVFNEAINTGKLYSFENDTLVSMILELYRILEIEEDYIVKRINEFHELYYATNPGYWQYYESYFRLRKETDLQDWMFDPKSPQFLKFKDLLLGSYSMSLGHDQRYQNDSLKMVAAKSLLEKNYQRME